MTTKTLDPEVISSVSKKLDEFSEVLSEEEHAVLLGILGLAESAIAAAHRGVETESGRLEDHRRLTLPSSRKLPRLSKAFEGSFSRLADVTPGDAVSDSVGVGVVCVSWTKELDKPAELDHVAAGIPGLRVR